MKLVNRYYIKPGTAETFYMLNIDLRAHLASKMIEDIGFVDMLGERFFNIQGPMSRFEIAWVEQSEETYLGYWLVKYDLEDMSEENANRLVFMLVNSRLEALGEPDTDWYTEKD